jgi:hypothetical protein
LHIAFWNIALIDTQGVSPKIKHSALIPQIIERIRKTGCDAQRSRVNEDSFSIQSITPNIGQSSILLINVVMTFIDRGVDQAATNILARTTRPENEKPDRIRRSEGLVLKHVFNHRGLDLLRCRLHY